MSPTERPRLPVRWIAAVAAATALAAALVVLVLTGGQLGEDAPRAPAPFARPPGGEGPGGTLAQVIHPDAPDRKGPPPTPPERNPETWKPEEGAERDTSPARAVRGPALPREPLPRVLRPIPALASRLAPGWLALPATAILVLAWTLRRRP